MKINNIFSENLIRLRKLKGYSQRDLAKKVEISQRMVNYYENNPNSIQIQKLKILADSLDAKISEFFNEDVNNSTKNIDVRWIKKIYDLKKLTENEQKEINKHINYLLDRKQKNSNNSQNLKITASH